MYGEQETQSRTSAPADAASTPSAAKSASRRWLLGASGAALLTAACSPTGGDKAGGQGSAKGGASGEQESTTLSQKAQAAPKGEAPNGALGVNFNEDPSDMSLAQVRELRTKWVRGFVAMTDKVDGDPAGQPAIAQLNEASAQGFRTILSLKFPFKDRKESLPKVGSAQMKAELARVDRVLRVVMGKSDILTIGNEPFLETLEDERDTRLNVFYEHVAEHVIAYRAKHFPQGCKTRLYMGALNHLDSKDGRTQATERWVTFVNRKPELEGLDIHPHVDSLQAAQQYVQYVVSRLEKDKKFLATEFSLKKHWENHMHDEIPAAYAEKYDVPPRTQVWQVIGNALDKPFPQQRWDDFLAMSPWFAQHKEYLTRQVEQFRETGKLAVATYGVAQIESMETGWGPDKDPWILNPLYANRTVRTERGRVGRTTVWFDSFVALQKS